MGETRLDWNNIVDSYIIECLLQVGDEDDQEELIEALSKLLDFCSLLQQLFA